VSVRLRFCIQHSRFLSLQYPNIYLSRFKCKNFWGFQATRTNSIFNVFVVAMLISSECQNAASSGSYRICFICAIRRRTA